MGEGKAGSQYGSLEWSCQAIEAISHLNFISNIFFKLGEKYWIPKAVPPKELDT